MATSSRGKKTRKSAKAAAAAETVFTELSLTCLRTSDLLDYLVSEDLVTEEERTGVPRQGSKITFGLHGSVPNKSRKKKYA